MNVDSWEYRELTVRCATLQAIATTHYALANLTGQAAAERWVQHEHPLEWHLFLAPTVDRKERVGFSRFWRWTIYRHVERRAGSYHYTFEVGLL